MRNKPKSLPRISPGRSELANAAATEVMSAGITMPKTPSVFNRPLSLCIFRLNSDIGINAMRFAACAACCPTPRKIVSMGMSNVPPPIPIPPSIPEKKPARIYR